MIKVQYNEGKLSVTSNTKIILDDNSNIRLIDTKQDVINIKSVQKINNYKYMIILEKELCEEEQYRFAYNSNVYDVIMQSIYSNKKFEDKYTYNEDDLGANWSKEKTVFKLWAPTAKSVKVHLYKSGDIKNDDIIDTHELAYSKNGVWEAVISGNLDGVYYTYEVDIRGNIVSTYDPYAKACGANGHRSMVVDLKSTNPTAWDEDTNPNSELKITDSIIYEIHIRDFSMDKSSGINTKGKYISFMEEDTTTSNGIPTCLAHIKDLGITHLHILPFYDFGSVDESDVDNCSFNWGYDPVNFNVPEGSYSSDAQNAKTRIIQLKQMIRHLHQNGISVVMDVVYNHVYEADDFSFNKIVPKYFSRIGENGQYSNGSGCGNDTASERSMVKKYIVDSVKYWASEYHIDGFRFDLVGLLDIDTVNEIVTQVSKIRDGVIFYGEGWSLDTKLTKKGYTLATQKNSSKTPNFAYFNDSMRDLVRGSVFENTKRGYISGENISNKNLSNAVMGMSNWCKSPTQTINYVSCHDNMTLFDKIAVSTVGTSRQNQIKMNKFAGSIYILSQGIPFIHAGEEMLRSKIDENGEFVENSYKSSDLVNSIKWDTLEKAENQNVYQYYKGLIQFRKMNKALRFDKQKDIIKNMKVLKGLPKNVLGFCITQEKKEKIYMIFNPNDKKYSIDIPKGIFEVFIDDEKAGTKTLRTIREKAVINPISSLVFKGI